MTWNYSLTPYFAPSFITILLLLVIFIYSWRRRSMPGALPISIGALFNVLLVLVIVMQYSAVDNADKILWYEFRIIWTIPAITCTTCFILEYTWPKRWITLRRLILASIPWLLTIVLVWTNDFHHILWAGFTFDGSTVIPLRALFPWLLIIIYGIVLNIINLTALIWLIIRSRQNPWPVIFIMVGLIVSRGGFLISTANLIPAIVPNALLLVAFEFLMYAIALFAFQILDPVSVASQVAIKQLRAGMIVLNNQKQIISLNPAAERILNVTIKEAKNLSVSNLLPACSLESIVDPNSTDIEFKHAGRNYILTISLLKDWRDLKIGYLLLFYDQTAQKQAQAQVLEQQRAMAVLQERERLAWELHDSTAQVLGYVSLQAQTICKQAKAGDLRTVEAQLTRLAQNVQEAHVDVRESILNLKTGGGQTWSFQTVLREYLDKYSEQYNIQTRLNLPDDYQEAWIEPETGIQLLRVIQEALTNARKHGKANVVQINFVFQDDQASIFIADDGCGMNLEQKKVQNGHYGFQFMLGRMQGINGSMKIDSEPGNGTVVILRVPLKLVQEAT